MLTPEQERLEAVDSMLDDYAVINAETRARLAWLEAATEKTRSAVGTADPDEAASLTQTMIDVARLKGVLEGRLAVYRYYESMLIRRRTDIVGEP